MGAKLTKKVMTTSRHRWIKSSHSNASAGCVEVMFVRDATLVRDSKDIRWDQPTMSVCSRAWRQFLDTIRQ